MKDAQQILKGLPEEKITYYCDKIKNVEDDETIGVIFDYLINFVQMCKTYSNK